MPQTPLDNAFGQSLSAWVARVTQQLKAIEQMLSEQRGGLIETNQELEAGLEKLKDLVGELAHKFSLFTLQVANIEIAVKELQNQRNYMVGAVMLSVLGAVMSVILVKSK